jgi:hypothetical protein
MTTREERHEITVAAVLAVGLMLLAVIPFVGCHSPREVASATWHPTPVVWTETPDPLPNATDEFAVWFAEHAKTCKECGGDHDTPICVEAFEHLQASLKKKITPSPRLPAEPQEAAKPVGEASLTGCPICDLAEHKRRAEAAWSQTGRADHIVDANNMVVVAKSGAVAATQPRNATEGCFCGNPQCPCGPGCQCAPGHCDCIVYTAAGYRYRRINGRYEVLMQRCNGQTCSQEWTDWYSLPNSQRASIRSGEKQGASGCASCQQAQGCASCGSGGGFFRRRGR